DSVANPLKRMMAMHICGNGAASPTAFRSPLRFAFNALMVPGLVRGGIEPAMIEIVAKDGTVYRVYGDKAVPPVRGSDVSCEQKNPWDEVLDNATKQKRTP